MRQGIIFSSILFLLICTSAQVISQSKCIANKETVYVPVYSLTYCYHAV